MQQLNPPDYSDPPFYQKEQDNQCPDCLFMDLNFRESDNLGFQPTTEQDFPSEQELYLTLNFNEEWLELMGGRVKFGIRAGELRLILNNGKVPYSHRNLNDRIFNRIDKLLMLLNSKPAEKNISYSEYVLGRPTAAPQTTGYQTVATTSHRIIYKQSVIKDIINRNEKRTIIYTNDTLQSPPDITEDAEVDLPLHNKQLVITLGQPPDIE